jgi:hypothetical protein
MIDPKVYNVTAQATEDVLAPLYRVFDTSREQPQLLLRLPSANVNTRAAEVKHANLLTFEGSIETMPQMGGACCAVYEGWNGVTLESRLATGTSFTIEDTFAILKQLADVLDKLESAGTIQLCLRPATILLGEPMQVRLFDHVVAYESLSPEALAPLATWLPPEYFAGMEAGGTAHVFAVARIAYRLLFSQDAFAALSLPEELFRISHSLWHEEPVGIAIKPTFERAFSCDPAARYLNCGNFVSELQAAWRAAASAPTRLSESALPPAQPVSAQQRNPVTEILSGRRVQAVGWAVAGLSAVLALVCAEATHRMNIERQQTDAEISQAESMAWAASGVAGMGLVNGRISVCNSSPEAVNIHRLASVYWGGDREPHLFSSPEAVRWHAQPGGAQTSIALSAPDGTLLWDGSAAFYVMEIDYNGQRYLTGGIWNRPPNQCLPLLHHS